VERARTVQRARGFLSNAAIPDARLDELVRAEPDALALLGLTVDRLKLSARAVRRVLRVARTIADLGERETTDREAIAEALAMRLPV
jgi:magnesium chelatase family protein